MNQNFPLPPGLPVPRDDGAADHLRDADLPELALPATDGRRVELSAMAGWWVLYVYPRTGQPGVPLPQGWNDIPGARGCTPQACSYRDHHAELHALGSAVYGLSSQDTDYQREAHERLHLPFPLLSDPGLRLGQVLRLPTFHVAGMELYRRLTLVGHDRRIRRVFYPVFPPDRNVLDVLAWLRANAR